MGKYFTEEKASYKHLLAGAQMNVVTEEVTVTSGTGDLKAGAVIGLKTADNKGALCDKSKSDGTQTPYGILLHDADTTSADTVVTVAVTGEFIEDNLTFGGDTTANDVRVAASARNIYFRKLVNK